MIRKSKVLILCAALLLAFSASTQAQDPTTTSQDEAEQQKEALKNKAYRLLDRIIDESQSLRLPENRVRIQINAADLIWDRDQGRARSLFMQASDGVSELIRSTPATNNQRGPQPDRRWFSLRQELVLAAARHDAPLAYQILAATKQLAPATTSADGRNSRGQLNLDDNLEQTLLGRIAALDPKLAAQNAEQLMEKGQFPRTLGEVINQLQRQDPEAADKLADKTVKRIQSANLLTNTEAGSLAQSLIMAGPRLAATPETSSQTQSSRGRGPVLDQSDYTELLSTVIDAALKATPQQQNNQRTFARGGGGPNPRVLNVQPNNQATDLQVEQNNARRLLSGLQATLPSIDLYLPARANAVRQKLVETGMTDATRQNFGQTMIALQQGNVTSDTLMQAAAAAPGPMQSRLYQQAAVRALEEGNTDLARQIATDHLQAGTRDSVMQRIDFKELAKKGEGARLDEIRQNIARLSSESEKVALLLQIAGDLQKDNPKFQLQLLDEAKQIVSHRAANYDQFETQLRVARAFSSVDPAKSFEVLEPGISQLNELLSAASVLSGFEVNVFRDGEMLMSGQGGSGLNSTIYRFGQELAVLAQTDFERSETLAGRFQFTEPRIMARMSIVQGALGVQSSTNPIPFSPMTFRNFGGNSIVINP